MIPSSENGHATGKTVHFDAALKLFSPAKPRTSRLETDGRSAAKVTLALPVKNNTDKIMTTTEILNLLEHPRYDSEGHDQDGWSKDDLVAKAANLLAQAVGVSLAESSEYLFLNRNPIAAAAAKIREFEHYPNSVWIVGKLWVSGSLRGKFNSISTMRQTEFDNEDAALAAAMEYNRQDGIEDDAERQWAARETEKEFSL